MNQLVGQVAGDTLIHALEAAKDLVIAIFDVLDAGLEALRNGFMKEGIQIPILSAIYHRFTGQDLRIHLMQMLELVAAIPATALAIFINGEPPFRHAHPTPLAYTLDFSLPLPPAPARSTSNGSAPRPAMALAATAGAPAARSGSADSERPAVSGTEAWLLMSMYSVGKAVAMLCEVLAGAAKAKNKSNGLIAFIRVIQFVARAFEAGGGAGLSLRVTDKDAVKGLKIAIVSVLGVRLIADAIIIFSGWKPNGYVPINDGDGGGGESSVEFFNKCLLGASFVCLCVNFTLEYIAIGLEWGDNKVEDDALLVVQQAFEYTGSFVSVASDAFEIKGQAFIASVVTVALVNVVALGSNIARTAIDAEHHRNY